jgi:AsmA protein
VGRIVKIVAYLIGALVGLLLVAGVSVLLLFDPNDYREEIERVVQQNTGRELRIEGDISVSIFPWLAIEVGPARLGNAKGFGDESFASFEHAKLSIRLLPMLFSREVEVATADLDTLQLNLAINSAGRSNWQDLIDISNAASSASAPEASGESSELNIAGIELRNSTISYDDLQAGSKFLLSELNIATGAISNSADGIDIDGFSIEALLAGVAEIPTVFGLETAFIGVNTTAETISLDAVEMDLLGLDISALVETFSYADEITPVAAIQVDAFSLRSLMQRLDIEAPETTDPTALGKVIIDATARVGSRAIALSDLTLVLDETTFKGELSIPQGDNDVFEFGPGRLHRPTPSLWKFLPILSSS